MREKITKRLESYGIKVTPDEEFGVLFCLERVQNKVKNMCNQNTIPKELETIVINMVCGEFLFMLKNMGKLDEKLDLEKAISQISEGDTSITFASTNLSNEQRFDLIINNLITSGENEVLCYRRLKW